MNLMIYDWSHIYFLAQSYSGSSNSGGNPLILLIYLVGYIFSSFCFYKIYQKLGESNAWFAWVPFLAQWKMYEAGDQSPWWIIAFLIPIVNLVAVIFLIIAFVNIVKKLGKNPWLILLMILPLVNLGILYYFAFV